MMFIFNKLSGFPGGFPVVKEFAWPAGDLGLIPGSGRSLGGRHGNPLQYSCLENPHGERSLVGYIPWDHKELGMTEWLSTAQTMFIFNKLLDLWIPAILFLKVFTSVLLSRLLLLQRTAATESSVRLYWHQSHLGGLLSGVWYLITSEPHFPHP